MKEPDVERLVLCMHQAGAAFWKGIIVGVLALAVLQMIYWKLFKPQSKGEVFRVKIEDKQVAKCSQRKAAVLEKMKMKFEADTNVEKLKAKYPGVDWSVEKDQEYYNSIYDSKVEELQNQTVAQLRAQCKSWGLPVGGLKDDLVHRLADWECERMETCSNRMVARVE